MGSWGALENLAMPLPLGTVWGVVLAGFVVAAGVVAADAGVVSALRTGLLFSTTGFDFGLQAT